jgi:N-acetylmuramoyl-L-alanine amidase
LVESGFLSNDEEARKIATPAYRQQIALALAAGIEDYADQIDALSSNR